MVRSACVFFRRVKTGPCHSGFSSDESDDESDEISSIDAALPVDSPLERSDSVDAVARRSAFPSVLGGDASSEMPR